MISYTYHDFSWADGIGSAEASELGISPAAFRLVTEFDLEWAPGKTMRMTYDSALSYDMARVFTGSVKSKTVNIGAAIKIFNT
jgi:hypothetical protein